MTERLALALFRLNEHDPNLGVVTPDGLACSDGRFARPLEIKYCGNASRGLNLQASAGLGEAPNYARDRMLSEKDLPGLQQTPSRRRLPSVQRALPTLHRKPAGDVGLDCRCELHR